MESKYFYHGRHTMNDDTNGYLYRLAITDSVDYNPHMHKCYEFIHVIRGKLLYTVEGREYSMSDGDLIMTKPDELHSFSFPDQCEFHREFLHIYPGFISSYPELLDSISSRELGHLNRIRAELVKKYGIDKIFKDIEICCRHLEPETDYIMSAYTLLLISRIAQILRKEIIENQNNTMSYKANAICKYIDQHYNEKISVKSIADSMFMSPGHLSRIFKKDTGMTVKEYLNMRRITQAKNRIVQGQDLIKNIYWKCGFDDYSTFYRTFIKYTGMSPDAFKRSQNTV